MRARGRGVVEHAGMTETRCWAYLMDLNGVLMPDPSGIVSGAASFVEALRARGVPFLVFTNESIDTPRDLRARLLSYGLDIPEEVFWTSALATAAFLDDQRPGGSAYVVGEAGLTTALADIGYVLTDREPDYVVLGETRSYSFASITTAIRLVEGGARLLATNPDEKGPGREGSLPATGAVTALVERATGRAAYNIGKPNPFMLRSALRCLGAHAADAVVLGDRMDTDVRSGLEAGIPTILVLSGLSDSSTVAGHPYQPDRVIGFVAEIVDQVEDPFQDWDPRVRDR